jgi:biopolymer transport protein ExbB
MNEVLDILAMSGGEWVIWLLGFCSVLVVAVIGERLWVFRQERKSLTFVKNRMKDFLNYRDFEVLENDPENLPGAAGRIMAVGLHYRQAGASSVEEHVAGVRLVEKKRLEERLLILGTLGNNALFVGLFGTVLGVVKAFRDLGTTASAGPEVVMQGLSEALLATAVGLLVALPSSISYNFFQKTVNDLLTDVDALTKSLLAQLKATRS